MQNYNNRKVEPGLTPSSFAQLIVKPSPRSGTLGTRMDIHCKDFPQSSLSGAPSSDIKFENGMSRP